LLFSIKKFEAVMSSATFTLVSVYAQSAAADGAVVFAAHYLGVGCLTHHMNLL
jgi:hypothetical protein